MKDEAILFKLQRPLFSNREETTILCYNEDRSIFTEFTPDNLDVPLQEFIDIMFKEDEYKIYVLGTYDKVKDKITLVKRVSTKIIENAGMDF